MQSSRKVGNSHLLKHQSRTAVGRRSIMGASAFSVLIVIFFLILVIPISGLASDNSGTNPANFTYDVRFITETDWLTDDSGSLVKHTAEFRWPLGRDVANLRGETEGGTFHDMGKRFGMRLRANYQNLSLNTPTGGTSEVSGIGDLDARLLGIAYASKNLVIVPGLEAFFDTASNDFVGSGKTSLGPVVFAVFPGLLGRGSLFAPGYQYVFDIAGDDDRSDISRSQIDLYFVWMLAKGKNWLIVDPQFIIDHEDSDNNFGTIEAEWGFMIAPKQGISAYLRPGYGFGDGNPWDWNLEWAVKFVWR